MFDLLHGVVALCPRAITCCRFSSLKTLLMPTKATVPTSESTSRALFSLAGFQVIIIGRFWVTAEEMVVDEPGSHRQNGGIVPNSSASTLIRRTFQYPSRK